MKQQQPARRLVWVLYVAVIISGLMMFAGRTLRPSPEEPEVPDTTSNAYLARRVVIPEEPKWWQKFFQLEEAWAFRRGLAGYDSTFAKPEDHYSFRDAPQDEHSQSTGRAFRSSELPVIGRRRES